jgi:hypothetical protein
MIFIRDGGIREIPVKDAQKVNAYLEDYLTFWNKFSDGIKNNDRRIDKALVTFGKFIKSYRSI